jgi:HSP20 family protein
MPLISYDPFHVVRRHAAWSPNWPSLFDTDWFDEHLTAMPRVDVHENNHEIIVTAEIPGLESRDDVNISVHDRHLHLSGTVKRHSEQTDHNVFRSERFYGQFSRVVPLPAEVDESKATASYKNGILEVRIPKADKPGGRRIDVDFH